MSCVRGRLRELPLLRQAFERVGLRADPSMIAITMQALGRMPVALREI